MAKSPQYALRLVNEFAKAADAYASVGAAHPEDRDNIEETYIRAKLKLKNAIKALCEE